MEWSEPPATIWALFGVDMPDVVPFGLRFLTFLIEARDVGLVP